MRTKPAVLFLTLALALILPARAFAQCITCGHDFQDCRAYTLSRRFCGSPDCICVGDSLTPVAYLDALHPGLSTAQVRGHLIVSGSLAGSPARAEDIAPGDEILRINGKRLAELPCGSDTWQSREAPNSSSITLKRDNRQWEVSVRLVPIRSLLDAAWNGQAPQVRPTSLLRSERAFGKLYGPYITGIDGRLYHDRVIVARVLSGSPADTAGIKPGDALLAIDGVSIKQADQSVLSRLSAADYRYRVELTVERGTARHKAVLSGMGISKLLRGLALPLTERGAQVAVLSSHSN